MPVDHSENIVEIRNLGFSYGDKQVLKDINLEIHQGDYLGIVGPNGGGKTTLLKVILGLLKPTSGTVEIKHQKIGYVAQKATNFDTKFPITAGEVVGLGHAKPTDMKWALEHVGMEELKDRLIGDLSGGQQQRIFIARALAQRPQIIFLDEPTAGVDAKSQKSFYILLQKLNKELGITLVLVSHDLDMIADEVTEIANINETLTYYGNPQKFLKHHHD